MGTDAVKRPLPAPPDALPTSRIARGYIRVSDTRGRRNAGKEIRSPEMQHTAESHLAAAMGWDFDADATLRNVDIDHSGFTKHWSKRPGIAAHLADARAGRFHVLIIYKLSRLARRVRDALEIFEAFDAAGVTIVTVEERIDTSTAMGRLMRTILLACAEMEAETISEYTRAAHRARAESGLPPPSVPAWVVKGADGVPRVNEDAAAPLRRIVDLRLRGYGASRIAQTLNAEFPPPPRSTGTTGSAQWQARRVTEILSPRSLLSLAGIAEYHLAGGAVHAIESAHPAVITDAQYHALATLSDATRPTTDQQANKTAGRGLALETSFLLSGRARCGVCGGPMRSGYMRPKDKPPRRMYYCQRAMDNRKAHPKGEAVTSITAEMFEEAVSALIEEAILRRPDELTPTLPIAPAQDRKTRADAAALLARRERLALHHANGLLTDATFDEHLALINADLLALTQTQTDPDQTARDAAAAWERGDIRQAILYGVESASVVPTDKAERGGKSPRQATIRLSFPVAGRTAFRASIYPAGYAGERSVVALD